MKSFFTAAMFLAAAFLSAQTTVDGKTYFTEQDMAKFSRGSSSGHYIAVDGIVYDVTGVPAWAEGSHKGGSAGEDISGKITTAPHGKKVLSRLPVKGALVRGFTAGELNSFDGTGGKARYVAVDGVVYDVSDTPAWMSGSHKGGRAGSDITQLIAKAPHGKSVLSKRKVVGLIIK